MKTSMNTNLILAVLIVLLSAGCSAPAAMPAPTSEPPTAPPVEPTAEPTVADIAGNVQSESWKTYTNSAFGISFQYPSAWFGPEEYIVDQRIRVEVGSDIVYPYGTDRGEQIYELKNSYYVQIEYVKDGQIQAWDEMYQSLVPLQDGESISGPRSLIIRVRQVTIGRFDGIEYIATLSETAQTEIGYQREILLYDQQSNILKIVGLPNMVEMTDKSLWREAYQTVDEANLVLFYHLLESITIE